MKGVRTPTIHDVARHVGVSHMTVSRVINGYKGVRAETRKLVKDAIERLEFAPNQAARMLSGAEQVKVALLHRFPNPGSLGEFLVHLMDAATASHASLIVREIASPEEAASAVRDLVQRGVRGVILTPPLADDDELVALLKAERIITVAAGSTRHADRFATVGINDRRAATAMTEHLLSLGHRRIGFITGRASHASSGLRLAGYRDALEEAGIALDGALVVEGLYTYQSGLDAAELLLTLDAPPTAIFASNDDMAAATVAVAHRRRLDVPEELSVCGFDDTALATTIWPELTTIRQPARELTKIAFEMVLVGISMEAEVDNDICHIHLDHLLVRRQSDGPPNRI